MSIRYTTHFRASYSIALIGIGLKGHLMWANGCDFWISFGSKLTDTYLIWWIFCDFWVFFPSPFLHVVISNNNKFSKIVSWKYLLKQMRNLVWIRLKHLFDAIIWRRFFRVLIHWIFIACIGVFLFWPPFHYLFVAEKAWASNVRLEQNNPILC